MARYAWDNVGKWNMGVGDHRSNFREQMRLDLMNQFSHDLRVAIKDHIEISNGAHTPPVVVAPIEYEEIEEIQTPVDVAPIGHDIHNEPNNEKKKICKKLPLPKTQSYSFCIDIPEGTHPILVDGMDPKRGWDLYDRYAQVCKRQEMNRPDYTGSKYYNIKDEIAKMKHIEFVDNNNPDIHIMPPPAQTFGYGYLCENKNDGSKSCVPILNGDPAHGFEYMVIRDGNLYGEHPQYADDYCL